MTRNLILILTVLLAQLLPMRIWAADPIVTTQPAIVQTDSRNIVITFHANAGNGGLAGVTPPTKVYAHTGVITSASTSDTDWKYAPKWLDNSAKYELTYVGPNTWTLTIPSINEYYGITNPSERVRKLMFVFRNANGSKEGKTANGGDIAVDVQAAGAAVGLTSSVSRRVLRAGTAVNFTANATSSADMSLIVNGNQIKAQSGVTTLSASYTFASQGDYTVIAKAVVGGVTVADTLSYVCADAPKVIDCGVITPGATRRVGNVTRFAIAAPAKGDMLLVGSWNGFKLTASQLMNRSAERVTLPSDTTCMHGAWSLAQPYFWIDVPGLEDGKDYIYFYVADGERAVADPYSRLILDPNNDRYISSEVFPDMPAYPENAWSTRIPMTVYNSNFGTTYSWKVNNFKRPDAGRMVIYELLLRDFTGSNGMANASGTLRSAMTKLDYIASLGVNAIELMPVMEFGGNNSWGYNPNFYFAPDKAYGTPDDYRRFIDEAHQRGLAVILDVVFNQADGYHPWWMLYDSARNPFFNASSPHSYNVLNDWNQDNPLVFRQWTDALTYWMREFKIDGFRFDLVKGLGNNSSYSATYFPATNSFSSPSESATNRYNATRVARMKQLHDAMRKVAPDAYFINENLATAQEENEMAADGELNWANVNNAACEFAMGYQGADANRFYAPLDGGRLNGSTVSYAESHDEERMAYKQLQFAPASVKGSVVQRMHRLGSVAVQMLMAPGAHMIWQFQELGDSQTTKKSNGENSTDPKKVVWHLLDQPLNKGLMETYRSLLSIRRANPGLFGQDATVTMNCGSANWAVGRNIHLSDNQGNHLVAVINCATEGESDVPVNLGANPSEYRLLLASHDVTPVLNAYSTGVRLPAGAFAIFATAGVSGIDEISADSDAHIAPALYTIQGRRFPDGVEPQPGLYIWVGADGHATKILIQ